MIKETIGTLELPTLSALAIWKNEIVGQLSDGMWENTGPTDHWIFWHDLEAKLGGCKVTCAVSWQCRKVGYNLAGLYEFVGDRMVAYGRMASALRTLGWDGTEGKAFHNAVHAAEHLTGMTLEQFKSYKLSGKWAYSWIGDYMADVSVEIMAVFLATRYTMRELRKDVSSIKAAMKTVKR